MSESAAGDGGGATAEDIADAVWNEVIAGHATAGSTGKALSDLIPGSAVNLEISALEVNQS